MAAFFVCLCFKNMKINKTQYPIALLEALKALTIELRQIASQSSALVHEVEPGEKTVQKFQFNEAKLTFEITGFKLVNDTPKFLYYHTPKSSKESGQTGGWSLAPNIVKQMNHWIGVLQRISALDFDEITTRYEEEIYEDLKILDPDADTAPFNNTQQVVILNYLAEVKAYLASKSNEYNTKPIVDQIDRLSQEISSSPKNHVMRKLSAVLARIKKVSLFLYKEVVIVLRRKVIADAMEFGWNYLVTNLDEIISDLGKLLSENPQ